MPVIQSDGARIYYELNGPDGAPVVLFSNGIWQDTASWAAAVRDLGPYFRTLTYDCRGQGQSDKPDSGPYTPPIHARDVLALLDALELPWVHFVGLSNGGIIALHFAHLYPGRVRKLVLADTFTHIDGLQQVMFRSWRFALEAGGGALRFRVGLPWVWSARSLEERYDAVMAMIEKAERLPVPSSIHLIEGALTHDARPWLHEIRHPALVINGEQDLMVPLWRAEALVHALPDAQLCVIPGAAHAAWLEEPALFNGAVLDFLRS